MTDELRQRDDVDDTCHDPCKFCGTKEYEEYYVPRCAAEQYCEKDVADLRKRVTLLEGVIRDGIKNVLTGHEVRLTWVRIAKIMLGPTEP